MRVFEHPNMGGFKCPICGQSTDWPVVLVPIYGTQEGRNVRAEQVHLKCLKLTWYQSEGLIAMQIQEN